MEEDDIDVIGFAYNVNQHIELISHSDGGNHSVIRHVDRHSPIEIDSGTDSDIFLTDNGSDEDDLEVQIVRPPNPTPPDLESNDPPLPAPPPGLLSYVLNEPHSTQDGAASVRGVAAGPDQIHSSSASLAGDGTAGLEQFQSSTAVGELRESSNEPQSIISRDGSQDPRAIQNVIVNTGVANVPLISANASENSLATGSTSRTSPRTLEAPVVSGQVNTNNSSQNSGILNIFRTSESNTSTVSSDILGSAYSALGGSDSALSSAINAMGRTSSTMGSTNIVSESANSRNNNIVNVVENTNRANTVENTSQALEVDSTGSTGSAPISSTSANDYQGPNLITVSIPRNPVNSPNLAPSVHRDVVDLGEQNRSMEEFRTPKKRKLMTPEDKKTKSPCKQESDEEGDTCPICFELWTISGAHRLISLKCGHLFGQSCIEKWLKGQGGKCPHCNAKAKRQDIRVVYAKSIKALDTTERDQALRDLEVEREAKRKVELEAAQFRFKYHQILEECNSLRSERDELKREIANLRDSTGSGHLVMPASQSTTSSQLSQLCRQAFTQSRTINVSETGKCRVLAYSSLLGALLVSQPSNSQLFKGFGVKKISTIDFKTTQFLTIHSKAIRDIAFHPVQDDGILLSCGTDKCVKMTNVMSNSVVQTYECTSPVWSCVWNTDDKCYFYAGLQNGTVLEYDTRNTTEAVQEINKDGSKSPVVSLQYVPKDNTATFKCEGLLVGQLDRTSFFEKKTGNEMKLHLLPLDGSLTSLCFERSTRQLLASFRPSSKYLHARHQLCRMSTWMSDSQTMEEACTCTPMHTFKGSATQAMLSRSTLFPTGDDADRLIVCAGDEPSSMLFTWDSVTGKQVQRMSSGGVAIDMVPLDLPDQKCLATLTEKQVKIFKWS